MGLITENWDAYRYAPGESAHRQFLATGFLNDTSARAGCPVKPGSTLPRDARLIAGVPQVSTPEDPSQFLLDFDYSPTGVGSIGDAEISKLNEPPEYELQVGEITEGIDKDIYGNPIVNSAGDPFDSAIQRAFTTLTYVYTRWESRYNGEQAIAYRNRRNSDRALLPGFGFIEIGQGLCKMPRTLSSINKRTVAVQVQYKIELQQEGFDTRILDKGTRAYYAADKPAGPIFNDAGQQISNAVRLNGQGIPKESGYKVNDASTSPLARSTLPKQVKVEQLPLATYLKYEIFFSRPFAALGLTE